MCIGVLHACMSVYHFHAWFSQRTEEGTGSSGLELQMVASLHMDARIKTMSFGRVTNNLTHLLYKGGEKPNCKLIEVLFSGVLC